MASHCPAPLVASRAGLLLVASALLLAPRAVHAQEAPVPADTSRVSIHLVDTDLRAAIQALARELPLPVVTSGIPAERITLETPQPVPRSEVLGLLSALVASHGLVLDTFPGYYRIAPVPPVPSAPAPGLAPGSDQPLQLFVIRLKHAKAPEVAATLNLLFGGSGAFAGQALSTGLLSDELRRDRLPPLGAPATAAAVVGGAVGATLTGQVTVVPNELTNSLLIRASAADFAVIEAAVQQVDVRPLQVLVEVLIVEARHDQRFFLGAEYSMPPQPMAGGTGAGTLAGGVGLGDLILRFMSISKADLDATIRLAASKGDVRIVSRPALLASNGTEARFLVGSQRPFVQVQRSLPTETANRDQVVQYKDVGTELTVLPTINHDGYVSLLLQQQINEATEETQFDAPVISTREARTQVLVKDGQTIVIGGLRDDVRSTGRQGLPVLSSIPLIGGLFGSYRKSHQQTEIFLFITPRIIYTDDDAERLTTPLLPAEGAP